MNKDEANHVGGIVGYLSAEPDAWVKDCSVNGLNITAYRDVAGIVGTTTGDGAAPEVSNNTVTNTVITADHTVEYNAVKAPNAGEIVGRQEVAYTGNNTVGEGVNVRILVSSVSDLKKYMKTKNTCVTLTDGTYNMDGNYSLAEGVSIIGEGNVILKGTLTSTMKNVTIKNVTLESGNAQRWAYAKGTVTFEDCTINGTSVYAIHYDGTTDAEILYKNCTITGWAAIAGGHKTLTFSGCKIYGNGAYGLIRTYSDATIESCTFDVSKTNPSDRWQDGIHAVDCKITVRNCTNLNGEIEEICHKSGSGSFIFE